MSTQIVAAAPSAALEIKRMLDLRKEEFSSALAGRVNPESFARVAYATITKTPKLMEATPASIFFALLEAASLGLTPNGVLGEAYIVPFNNKVKSADGRSEHWEVQAQFIPGYRGLVKLARQSGVIRNIVARIVYKGDDFRLEYGLEETLHHIPNLDSDQSDANITHVYAVAHFVDGTTQFEVMTKKQVDGIRARSKASSYGPWVTDYSAMAIKTVIRRLVKYLPISDFDLAKAVEADDNALGADDIREIVATTVAQVAPVSRTAQLRDVVATRSIAPAAAVDEYTMPQPADDQSQQTEQQRPTAEQAQQATATASEEAQELPTSTLTGNDGPELDEFEELVEKTRTSPINTDADKPNARQVKELQKLAADIYGEGTRDTARLLGMVNSGDLTREEAVLILSAGKAVLKAREAAKTKPADGGAAAGTTADPFGEG